MAQKFGRKTLPPGYTPDQFTYQGRPAATDGDFGSDVGLADMGCVNQFGEANNSKAYHCGVAKTPDGVWWMYAEWGRIKPGPSWNNGRWTGNFQDFQFERHASESAARAAFTKKAASKNVKRGVFKTIGGVKMLVAKPGKDCYVVQDLATREKGLPDAATIKDSTGVTPTATATAAPTKKPRKAAGRRFHAEEIRLAQDLVGGTKTYTRALSAAAGVRPTMAAITRVRDQFIPAAMERIKQVPSLTDQLRDTDLQAITRTVAALVPRPIPRTGQDPADFLLSGNTILQLQQDLDAFEASLANEDFSTAAPVSTVNPWTVLNANVRYLPTSSPEGKWVASKFPAMTNHRHSYIRGKMVIKSIFRVDRPDRDRLFEAEVRKVAARRRGRFSLKANLQPKRTDLSGAGVGDLYAQANVIVGIHGTRPVNIAPIMGSNFRLPRSLPGAQITGANFGHGIYWATDWKKSYGYCGRGYWSSGGQGGINSRGCFMFLSDVIMGKAYRAPRTGSWGKPPGDTDSVFGVGGDSGHRLQNDEHVIFDPNYQRIRYLVEFAWLS